MLSDYHEKQANKVIRYTELAEKNEKRSDAVRKQADDMLSIIPFGQPILVGHYSEQRDRNYRNRAFNKIGKSIELSDKAKYYAGKVATIESNKAISQDNPDAISLLKEKLQKLEETREKLKAINKIVLSKKKNYTQEQKIIDLVKIDIKEETALKLFEPDFCGRIGIPDYDMVNRAAKIRNVKARIEQLEKNRSVESKEEKIGDITISDSTEDNRIMIFFPGIPSEEVRKILKSCGFRWSPSNKAWQAYQNNRTRDNIERYIKPLLLKEVS